MTEDDGDGDEDGNVVMALVVEVLPVTPMAYFCSLYSVNPGRGRGGSGHHAPVGYEVFRCYLAITVEDLNLVRIAGLDGRAGAVFT